MYVLIRRLHVHYQDEIWEECKLCSLTGRCIQRRSTRCKQPAKPAMQSSANAEAGKSKSKRAHTSRSRDGTNRGDPHIGHLDLVVFGGGTSQVDVAWGQIILGRFLSNRATHACFWCMEGQMNSLLEAYSPNKWTVEKAKAESQ